MKKIGIFILVFFLISNIKCQSTKNLLNFFPDIKKNDTIINTVNLLNAFYRSQHEIDERLSLKYFFHNKIEEMYDVEEGYNSDENSYTYTKYIKKVTPIFKTEKDTLSLLCYGIKSKIFLSIYDIKNDNIISTLLIVEDSDEPDNYIHSVLFSNDFILTIQCREKGFYTLTQIDYLSKEFIKMKEIEFDLNQSDNTINKKAFEILGISKKGELFDN